MCKGLIKEESPRSNRGKTIGECGRRGGKDTVGSAPARTGFPVIGPVRIRQEDRISAPGTCGDWLPGPLEGVLVSKIGGGSVPVHLEVVEEASGLVVGILGYPPWFGA